MTRDYKHSRARERHCTPGWIWMLTGLALGLLVAVAVYLHGQKQLHDMAKRTSSGSPRPIPNASEQPKADTREQRQFDFYTLLPELEVVVPEEPTRQTPQPVPKPKPVEPKPPARPSSGGYILQVGSFRRHAEADSLRAKLTLMGIPATIQTVRVDKDTWHRVRVGPYQNQAEANRVRARLRKNRIDAMLLKARG